jgi:aryl-alcohol dehydrogenase-like predicted oxidoreductase
MVRGVSTARLRHAMTVLPHRRLGRTGPEVSRIALGSWRTFERLPRANAERVMAHALERGIDFFDDARYDDETGRAPIPTGYSEVLFGELFRATGAQRDLVRVSNKLWWEFWPGQSALQELEGSLDRMGFERLDLMYSSTLPDEIPVPVALEQVATVLAGGRVGAWGVVNWSAEALAAGTREADRLGIPAPCAVQLPYSLAATDVVESPQMTVALHQAGASLVPSAALAGGALTGKYADPTGVGRLSNELGDQRRRTALRIGEALLEQAELLHCAPATVAVAFTLANPLTASTLIGATTPEQIDQSIAAIELAHRLTRDELRHLRELAEP